jgi:hypothetical protein
MRAVRRTARRAEGPGGELASGRCHGAGEARGSPGSAALGHFKLNGRLVLSAALERRFRPRLICDLRDPR